MAIKLTDDAKSALALFQINPSMKLVFNTPSRIHPRLRSAMDQLVEANLMTEEQEPRGHGKGANSAVTFYANPEQRDMIRQQPRISVALMKKTNLPMTVD